MAYLKILWILPLRLLEFIMPLIMVPLRWLSWDLLGRDKVLVPSMFPQLFLFSFCVMWILGFASAMASFYQMHFGVSSC